tara:strand:- start:19819 stop:20112 length:294 start_codon:yes stop_codon:yes gene_type:complete
MKLAIIAVVSVAVVTATPYPWAAPQASLVPTPSRTHNGTHGGNGTRKNPHKEPVPTFKTECECAKPIVPLNLLNANEVSGESGTTPMAILMKLDSGV